MFALKKNSEEEVDSLIDSMLRLIDYMNQNSSFKREIFNSFTLDDLQKILRNLDDSNIKLRKVSCLFLCSVLTNQENCSNFCLLLDLLPVNSKLCLTSVPVKISQLIEGDILNTLNLSPLPQEQPFCWYYSISMAKEKQNQLGWIFINQAKDIKKLFLNFLDPLESMVGIVYSQNTHYINKVSKNSISPNREESLRKSNETYHTFLNGGQQCINSILKKYLIAPIRAENNIMKHLHQFGTESNDSDLKKTSNNRNESASPQILRESLLRKQKVVNSNRNTPITIYNAFLNSTKLKMDYNKYNTSKSKPTSKIFQNYDIFKQKPTENGINLFNKGIFVK